MKALVVRSIVVITILGMSVFLVINNHPWFALALFLAAGNITIVEGKS